MAIAAISVARTAAPPAPRPDIKGVAIGTVDFDSTPRPGEPTIAGIDLQTSGDVVGAISGYSELQQARTATAKLTAGDQPVAAIFELGGRFFAQGIDKLTYTHGGRGQNDTQVQKLVLEDLPSRNPLLNGAIHLDNPAVQAIVDGARELRSRGTEGRTGLSARSAQSSQGAGRSGPVDDAQAVAATSGYSSWDTEGLDALGNPARVASDDIDGVGDYGVDGEPARGSGYSDAGALDYETTGDLDIDVFGGI